MEMVTLNKQRNVTLTAYIQGVGGEFPNISKRPAILVLPGGGYRMCSDREADPVAFAYLQAGFQTFVLRYSVGDITWPMPLEDYEQAMELIRSKAEEWNLYADKVAVIGFSAGGHLAASAATIARNKPNAAILGYPVTEGPIVKACLATAPDLVDKVDSKTAPCFLFATRTDNIVPISNTLNFASALDKHGIIFETHIYSYGPHGFSVGNSSVMAPNAVISPRANGWVTDSVQWLKEVLGDFGDSTMTQSVIGRRVNDDEEAFFSVNCTIECLMASEQTRAVLAPMMAAAREKMMEKYADKMAEQASPGDSQSHVGIKMTLRSVLAYGNVPKETVDQLDQILRQIPNKQ